ncbi:hypothetical protein [Streptomyces sp. SGAir0957]
MGGTAHCAIPDHAGRVLFTAIQAYADGHDDCDAMRKLIAACTKA